MKQSQWRQQAAKGALGPGTRVRFSRTFTAADVSGFGDLTRDYNPVHYEERFCRNKELDGPICHGLLVGSMICEPGGQWGWLASQMNLRFLRPVYVGDTVTCELHIRQVDERHRARAEAIFTNQSGEIVLEAELRGVLPGPRDQAVLQEMIDDDDPTNPLG